MPSILKLQNKLAGQLQQAIAILNDLPASTSGRNSALRTLQANANNIAAINIGAYRQIKSLRGDTAAIFDDPVRKALAAVSGDSMLDVPHDLGQMLKDQQNGAPDPAILAAIARLRKCLRSAYWDLRKMQDIRLRWAMSAWLPVLLFLFALLYGAGFFIFAGSHVDHPTASGGAARLLAVAAADTEEIKAAVSMASDPIDAAQKFLDKLTKLISQIPTIAVAVGTAWAAVRKIWQHSAG